MRELHMAYLYRRRAEHIREYVGAQSEFTRKWARNWALFYGGLIRKHGGRNARPA